MYIATFTDHQQRNMVLTAHFLRLATPLGMGLGFLETMEKYNCLAPVRSLRLVPSSLYSTYTTFQMCILKTLRL